mmetsp:Transcript_12026/g.26741  ORF Transcript_12026/g.26741 Transcript_12026/m.26741 type:complete len:219 (+) Transcript_12026:376-1032(+)
MDVVSYITGKLEIIDYLQVWEIVPSGKQPCRRHHDVSLVPGSVVSLEAVVGPLTIVLRVIGVHTCNTEPSSLQFFHEWCHLVLALGENQSLALFILELRISLARRLVLLQALQKEGFPVRAVRKFELLLNAALHRHAQPAVVPNSNEHGLVAAQLFGEFVHLLGPSGRPHQCLPLRVDLIGDLSQLIGEAIPGEQLVSLIQDVERHQVELEGTLNYEL